MVKLEEQLEKGISRQYIMNEIQISKSLAYYTTIHLQRIQDGLYELLKNKLSPKLIALHQISGTIDKIERIAMRRGFRLAILNKADIFQVQTNFVSMSSGIVTILTHLPIYKASTIMTLYKYEPMPIYLTDSQMVQTTIHPEEEIIGINGDKTLYTSYSSTDLNDNCNILHDKYYCNKHSVVTRIDKPNCVLGLYQQNKEIINETFSISFTVANEYVRQLNQTTFLIFTPKSTLLEINCNFGYHQTKWINQTTIVKLQNGCKGSIENYIFSAPIEISEEVEIKLDGKIFEILPLLALDDNELNMLNQIIKATKSKGTDNIKIRDIKRLFDLKILQKTHKTTSIIMKIISSIVAFFVTMLAIYVIYRMAKCITKRSSNKRTNMTIQLAPMSEMENKVRRSDERQIHEETKEYDHLINVNNSSTEETTANPLAGATIVKKSDT